MSLSLVASSITSTCARGSCLSESVMQMRVALLDLCGLMPGMMLHHLDLRMLRAIHRALIVVYVECITATGKRHRQSR